MRAARAPPLGGRGRRRPADRAGLQQTDQWRQRLVVRGRLGPPRATGARAAASLHRGRVAARQGRRRPVVVVAPIERDGRAAYSCA